MIPLQIICRDFRLTPGLRTLVREYTSRLEASYQRILRCEVTIASPHRHKRKGKIYHVSIKLAVPGPDIVVSREAEEDGSHEHLLLTIHDAFRAAERQLEDHVRRMRGDVKTLESSLKGKVTSIFPDLDYGFLESSDGQEVYFHRNSLKGVPLEKIKPGERVRFDWEKGDKGPQATFVRRVRKSKRAGPKAA